MEIGKRTIISIIVPIYNSEKTIGRCVESIINQTYKNLEIILVDDESKDASRKICDEFAKKDSRITVIGKSNGGVSSARNRGLYHATGEYVMFVDSDDYISLNMCEVLYSKAVEYESDLVVTGIHVIGQRRDFVLQYEKELFKSASELENKFLELYKKAFFTSPVNKLYKKCLINNFFRENIHLGEDLIFNLQYMEKCHNIITIRESLYHYYNYNESSLSKKKMINWEYMIECKNQEIFQFIHNNFLNYQQAAGEILEFILVEYLNNVLFQTQINYNEFKKKAIIIQKYCLDYKVKSNDKNLKKIMQKKFFSGYLSLFFLTELKRVKLVLKTIKK